MLIRTFTLLGLDTAIPSTTVVIVVAVEVVVEVLVVVKRISLTITVLTPDRQMMPESNFKSHI